MENSIDNYIRDYLKPDQKKAFDVILEGFGIQSLDEFSEKIFGINIIEGSQIENDTKDIELTDIIRDDVLIKKMDPNLMDIDLFLKNSHLPIRDTFNIILGIFIVKIMYPRLGLEGTVNIINHIQLESLYTLIIEGDQNRGVIAKLDSLVKDLIEIDKREKLYDWPYSRSELELLFQELSKLDYIGCNKTKFTDCFKNENPTIEDKIVWKNGFSELVYMGFGLWHQNPNESHLVLFSRFHSNDVKYDPTSIRKRYNGIKNKPWFIYTDVDDSKFEKTWRLRDIILEIKKNN